MDLSDYSLIFEEQFRQSEVQEVGKDWQHTLFWGARTIGNNGELQLYVDPKFRGLGLNPFRLTGNAIAIRARPATPKELPYLGGLPYVSGMLTSERRFSAQYGYFEVRAKLPAGRGLWPAVWLLPIDGTWPPEIDIVEAVGQDPTSQFGTMHWGTEDEPQRVQPAAVFGRFDASKGFHTYGVDWQADRVTWYYDGVEVGSAPNRIRGQAMYLLANLAVGGHWAGAPDATTRFPAEMVIDYVRVWHRRSAPTVGPVPKRWPAISRTRFPKLTADGAPITTAWSYRMAPAERKVRSEGRWSWFVTGNDRANVIVGSGAKYNELEGGKGDDVLTGRGGNDVFIIRRGDGFDVITDFSNRHGNRDKIRFHGLPLRSFEDVLAWSRQMGRDVMIRLGRDQALLLRNKKLADLSPEQFIFVTE